MNSFTTLPATHFADLFGTSLTAAQKQSLQQRAISYRRLDTAERDAVLLKIVKTIDGFSKVGPHRAQIWNDCWADVLQTYLKSRDLAALTPPFVVQGEVVRFLGDYAQLREPGGAFVYYQSVRDILFDLFLRDDDHCVEVGCGSGHNLAALARQRPGCTLLGLDWSSAAVELLRAAAADHRLSLESERFDLFNCADLPSPRAGSVIMTFAALEQVGASFDPFLAWVMKSEPRLVVHLEPVMEVYDQDLLFDWVAARFHEHRGYLTGYAARIRALAASGKAEIVFEARSGVGNLYHEGSTILVWRPTGR